MRIVLSSILVALVLLAGCSQNTATEGKVTITSTKVFGKMKGSKSPPPQIPKG